MENGTGKGSEFNDIIETWEQNEKRKEEAAKAAAEGNTENEAPTGNTLDEVEKQEATEYDNENKENRVLSGDRATIDDDGSGTTSGE